jgi:hypothetical protein
VRREGRVSTSRPPKSHVVDRYPFAEPPEGHVPTALCEISLHHPVRPTPSSRTRSSRTIYPVIPSVPPSHPELDSGSDVQPPVMQSRFRSYVCNCRARMFASEGATQYTALTSPISKNTCLPSDINAVKSQTSPLPKAYKST